MGLDMYLKARTSIKSLFGKEEATGACGGFIPLAPSMDEDMIEIGYWRKAYNVNEEIWNTVDFDGEDDNCVDIEMTEDNCEHMLDWATTKLSDNDFEDDWEKEDLESTIDIFKKALALFKLDKDCEIYYHQWY